MSPTPPAQELHDWSIRVDHPHVEKPGMRWAFIPKATFLYAYQQALALRWRGQESWIRIQALDTDPTC